ncbi:putative holin-like toxin [Coprococcus comes ATCC 27758]|uniref:putative holin-like toxin n=1 Tax=Coprococcus comes TaxID=410072 RepID=UPI001959C8D9|nr:putative holin-like toxin [Coprococcus comes]QRT51418.1 hypothetical protein I6K69_09290 [Coprococcus comes]UWP14013.1 putative holin-like toxin [Coprococcus comes ATCC 27758]
MPKRESTEALYFQYGLEADDDGFVSAPKKILRLTNASDDDLKILVAKGFLIPFDSGVVVIRDWKINNYLRRDRYTPTRFKEEFEQLDTIDDRYQLHVLAVGIPDDNHVVDMVTYSDLIQFSIFIVALVGLCYEIFKGKRK